MKSEILSATRSFTNSVSDIVKSGSHKVGDFAGRTVKMLQDSSPSIAQHSQVAMAVISNLFFFACAQFVVNKFRKPLESTASLNKKSYSRIAINGLLVGGAVLTFNVLLSTVIPFPLDKISLIVPTIASIAMSILLNSRNATPSIPPPAVPPAPPTNPPALPPTAPSVPPPAPPTVPSGPPTFPTSPVAPSGSSPSRSFPPPSSHVRSGSSTRGIVPVEDLASSSDEEDAIEEDIDEVQKELAQIMDSQSEMQQKFDERIHNLQARIESAKNLYNSQRSAARPTSRNTSPQRRVVSRSPGVATLTPSIPSLNPFETASTSSPPRARQNTNIHSSLHRRKKSGGISQE